MLAFYTILAALLLGLGVGFLLGRSVSLRKYWYYVSAGLFVVGLALTWLGAGRVQREWHHRSWPSVAGTVLDSRVAGTRAFHPVVVYEYRVGSVTYRDSTGLHQPSFGGKRKRYDVAVKAAAEYVPGMTVPVHYNPANPSESVLKISVYWADYGITGVGALLVALGVCLTIAMVRSRSGSPEDPGSRLA
jgi:hypothetical protein